MYWNITRKWPVETHIQTYFTGFLIFHVLIWTLMPVLVRDHLPMDSLEAAAWGQHWLLGYDKNPYVNAWLVSFLLKLSRGHDWIIYFGSASLVAVAFWAIYRVSQRWLGPVNAFVAVFMLEGFQYYNIAAIELNDNLLELALWPLALSFFYTALKDKKDSHFLWVGLFAGLSLMSKYLSLVLVLSMLGFMWLPYNRHQWRNPWFVSGVSIMLALVLPHFIWLFNHDFMTVAYAKGQMHKPTLWQHITNPVVFLIKCALYCLGPLLLVALSTRFKKPERVLPNMDRFDWDFLWMAAVGPLLILCGIVFFTGSRMTTMWGQPLLSWVGVLLVALFAWQFTETQLKNFMGVIAGLTLVLAVGHSISLLTAGDESSANFPGRALANYIEHTWSTQTDQPLYYVAGDRFLSGSIAHYSDTHPTTFFDWNTKTSPWIDLDDIKRKGAVLVWKNNKTPKFIDYLDDATAEKLILLDTHHFSWTRSSKNPIPIRVAILPPDESR